MYHVHVNILIFQSLLMVFNSDMHDMCSCKQNHVLFIACNHGNWNVYSWFYSYGMHPTNDLLSCIHLKLVCTVQELNQGCRQWGGGFGGFSPPPPPPPPPHPPKILGCMGLMYIHLHKSNVHWWTSLTHTLLSSPPPAGWFAVAKITVTCSKHYNLSCEYLEFFCAFCALVALSKLSPLPTF